MRRFVHLVLIFLFTLGGWTIAVSASPSKVMSTCITNGTINTIHKALDGANDTIEVPPNWNGILLLYSHGYIGGGPLQDPGQDAPDAVTGSKLLKEGYALAGSSYSQNGWVAGLAMNETLNLLNYFEKTCGKPQKGTITWGESMGGLVSAGLAHYYSKRFIAAVPMCGVLTIGKGELAVPVLTLHTIGDDFVSVHVEGNYAQVVKQAGSRAKLRQIYVARDGHCNFTPGNFLSAIHTVVNDALGHGGQWGNYDPNQHPDKLNNQANSYGSQYNSQPPNFQTYTAEPSPLNYPTLGVDPSPDYVTAPHKSTPIPHKSTPIPHKSTPIPHKSTPTPHKHPNGSNHSKPSQPASPAHVSIT